MFSTRSKHAFTTALAVAIAYAIALYMDWDKPIWAGWTAAAVSLDATGQSIQKGLNRIAGAMVGSIASFILLAFFIQDRWLFFMFLSLYVAVFTYFSSKRSGKLFLATGGLFRCRRRSRKRFQPANAFEIAIERTQWAGTGLLVYMLVGLLLWPTNSRSSLENAGLQLPVSELLADVRSWRVAVQEILGQLAEKPEASEAASLQSRLNAVLVRLETRIEEAVDKINGATVSEEESKNMYRLLSVYRGSSEALVDYARKSVGIDWTRSVETRF